LLFLKAISKKLGRIGELRGLEVDEREGELLEDKMDRVRRERLFEWVDKWGFRRFWLLLKLHFLLIRAL